MIVKRVRDGAGLVMLGGYHSLGPGGYARHAAGRGPAGAAGRPRHRPGDRPVPARAHARRRAAPDLRQHRRLLPHPRQAEPKDAGLPPLDGCTRVEAAAARRHRAGHAPAEAEPMPVLAVQPLDKGRTAVFCGDTTRKWQQGPRALDQESPFLRFWGQMVRWLAGRATTVEAKASVTGQHRQGYYEPEEPIRDLGRRPRRGGRGRQADAARSIGRRSASPERPARTEVDVSLAVVPAPAATTAARFEPQGGRRATRSSSRPASAS